jgi:hypothetical protein
MTIDETINKIIENYEQCKPITQGIKYYDIYRLALDK